MMEPLAVLRQFAPHDFSLDGFFRARLAARVGQAVRAGAGAGARGAGDAGGEGRSTAQAPPPLVTYVGAGEVAAGREMGWAECAQQVDQAVAWLRSRGLSHGDRLGLMAFNHPATLVLLLACARLGLILVPCNPEFGAQEAGYIFGHAQVRGVVCSAEAQAVVRDAVRSIGSNEDAPWTVVLETELEAQWQACAPDAHTRVGRADDTLFILYTSGTTGFPKGVMHSQRTYVLTAESFVQRMHLQPDERLMCVLPLFHINALMYSLGGAIACGATLVLVRRFSASTFWRTAAATGATEVNVIMSAAAILARRAPEEFDPGHRLAKMFIAPLNRDLKDAFEQRFGVPVLIECYGMTEIPGLLANPFKGPHKLGSMGIVSAHPDPNIERPQVRLIDANGLDVARGQVGELVARTPTLMQGYFRDPQQTAQSFIDGWFRSGDLALQDEDGYFRFHARHKDIIRRRGENIAGAEVDAAIGSHPDVLECAAIGVPAELGEEEILCAVVPRPGAVISPQQVHAHAQQCLSALKYPRYIVIVDSLPHTGSMKIAKFRLKPEADALRARATDFGGAATVTPPLFVSAAQPQEPFP